MDLEWLDIEELQAVLDDYGQEVRNLYQDNLIRNDRIASGDLLNSVNFIVERNGSKMEVFLDLAKYWKFMEQGVNGTERDQGSPYSFKSKRVNVPAILNWIRVKPVIPKPDDNGRIPTPESLAYALATTIARKGLKGDHGLRDALEEVNEKYRYKILQVFSGGSAENLYNLLNIRGILGTK